MGGVRRGQENRERPETAAARTPWSGVARIAGIVAAGTLVATWLSVVPGSRQRDADRRPAAVAPAVEQQPLPAGLREGAAKLRERLRESPRPVEGARNPFRLPPAGERAAPLPSASTGRRPVPRAGGRSAAGLEHALIGIATTEAAEGPQRTAVLLRRGEVVLAEPGQALGGGWMLEAVEETSATFRHAAGHRQRRTLP